MVAPGTVLCPLLACRSILLLAGSSSGCVGFIALDWHFGPSLCGTAMTLMGRHELDGCPRDNQDDVRVPLV